MSDKNFDLLKSDPQHPSLHFKRVDPSRKLWSVRVGIQYCALGVEKPDGMVWFWIGTHAEDDKLVEGEIIKYILNNPKMLEVVPEKFELVLLPEDDPEVLMLNMDLLDKYGSEGKPIVFARVNTHATKWKPNIFVPVVA